MRKRLRVQPMPALTAIEIATTASNTGQWLAKPPTMAGVIERAMRQPITAWAAAVAARGTVTAPPAVCTSTATASGPSSRAAGSLAHWRSPAPRAEAARSTAQRPAVGKDRSGRPLTAGDGSLMREARCRRPWPHGRARERSVRRRRRASRPSGSSWRLRPARRRSRARARPERSTRRPCWWRYRR